MESDLIGLSGGINTFVYSQNSPITYIDPFGLFCLPWGGFDSGWLARSKSKRITEWVGAFFPHKTFLVGNCVWYSYVLIKEVRVTRSDKYCRYCRTETKSCESYDGYTQTIEKCEFKYVRGIPEKQTRKRRVNGKYIYRLATKELVGGYMNSYRVHCTNPPRY